MSNTQKESLNHHLANFIREYNAKYPKEKITEREFNILHEFKCYLTPVEELQKILEAV